MKSSIIFIALVAFAVSTAGMASTVQTREFTFPDDAPAALDIDGDRIVIGVPKLYSDVPPDEGAPRGEVFLCKGTVTKFDCATRFLPVNPVFSDEDTHRPQVLSFGGAVALGGGRVAVAQTIKDGDGKIRHSTAVYEGPPWRKVETISAGGPGDLELYRDYLFIGTGGAVKVYNHADRGWREVQILRGESGSEFGASIHVDTVTGILLVGAPAENVDGLFQAGSVHAFREEGNRWVRAGTFTSDTPTQGGRFGRIIASKGQYLFISSPGNGVTSGIVSVMKMIVGADGQVTLSNPYRILPKNARQGAFFGIPVIPGKDRALIGSVGPSGNMENGSLAIFQMSDADEWYEMASYSEADDEWVADRDPILPPVNDEVSVALEGLSIDPVEKGAGGSVSDDGIIGSDAGAGSFGFPMFFLALLICWVGFRTPRSN